MPLVRFLLHQTLSTHRTPQSFKNTGTKPGYDKNASSEKIIAQCDMCWESIAVTKGQ